MIDCFEDSAWWQYFCFDFADRSDGHLSIEDPLEITEVVIFVVREENILVGLEGIFSMLFEDVFLDAIVIQLDVLFLLNIFDCNKEGFPLILC